MRRWRWRWAAIAAPAALLASLAAWHHTTRAKQAPRPAAGPTRFEFLVVESIDARYLGDTPGHRGRGALGRAAPRAALADPVYRGQEKVGRVTHLAWDEAREGLEVEFDPEPGRRVAIGDPVWIAIGADAEPPRGP